MFVCDEEFPKVKTVERRCCWGAGYTVEKKAD